MKRQTGSGESLDQGSEVVIKHWSNGAIRAENER